MATKSMRVVEYSGIYLLVFSSQVIGWCPFCTRSWNFDLNKSEAVWNNLYPRCVRRRVPRIFILRFYLIYILNLISAIYSSSAISSKIRKNVFLRSTFFPAILWLFFEFFLRKLYWKLPFLHFSRSSALRNDFHLKNKTCVLKDWRDFT